LATGIKFSVSGARRSSSASAAVGVGVGELGRMDSGLCILHTTSKYRIPNTETKTNVKNAAVANGINTFSTTTPVVMYSRHRYPSMIACIAIVQYDTLETL